MSVLHRVLSGPSWLWFILNLGVGVDASKRGPGESKVQRCGGMSKDPLTVGKTAKQPGRVLGLDGFSRGLACPTLDLLNR